MLQMFYLDIAKVDRGVAYVAMHVRSGGGESGLAAQASSRRRRPAWAREMQARAGAC
jgi:hypothetical protein